MPETLPPTSPAPAPVSASLPTANCGDSYHNCLDVLRPDQCCDNKSYCYINRANQPRCCPLGSNCVGDSPCPSDAYSCSGRVAATVSPGCCARKCPQPTYYLCEAALGGKCCPYGSQCRAGGNCVQRQQQQPPPPSSVSALNCSASTALACLAPSSVAVSETYRLPPGAKVGLGVGIAVSALSVGLLMACLAVSYTQRRRRERVENSGTRTGTTELVGAAVQPPPQLPPLGDHRGPEDSHTDTTARTCATSIEGTALPSSAYSIRQAIPVEIYSKEKRLPIRSYPQWEMAPVDPDDGLNELDGSKLPSPRSPTPSSASPP
ncbi:uncharacterized protein UV8b_07500 [Ustilaginoidea virens]|uniref:Uncharacterized protein n=1 Tax=Ustilaginoidea virens TaxID=1159556 RepID=A0A8E5HX88_USTVR|nr:uncharacterized protein UV8b_07500 [Ustilaginoidea virens]QUC23259.1 hypothetical protein UV8b_07500 [Ustilaginoidea virens]